MHKRILCLISAVILLLGLTACGDTEQPVVDATTTTTQAVGTTTDTSNAQTTLGSEVNSTVSTTKTTTTATTTAASDDTANDTQYAKFRKGLNNTYAKLTKEKELTIAYVGGSITAGASATSAKTESYRALTTAWFKKQFPDATITEINMGIGMAGSKLPAYYVKTELVPQKPDLIFLECAINDYIERNSTPIDQVKAQYETIVRQLRTADPTCEFVALYTTNAAVSATDEFFEQAAVQDAVAAHYGIPSINIGRQLRMRYGLREATKNGELTSAWKQVFADDVHPNTQGHNFYAMSIISVLETAMNNAAGNAAAVSNYAMPAALSDSLLMNVQYIKADKIDISASPDWSYNADKGYITTSKEGAELTVTFTGTALHFHCNGVQWTGENRASYSVDGGEWQPLNRCYIRAVPIVTGLSQGTHTVRFKCGTGIVSEDFAITALMVK